MTKYKEYFQKMVNANKELFDKFAKLHTDYGMDNDKFQEEFNKEGEKVQVVIHEWENRLCSHSEKAGYGGYTGNLAENFQEEISVKWLPVPESMWTAARKTRSISHYGNQLNRRSLHGTAPGVPEDPDGT